MVCDTSVPVLNARHAQLIYTEQHHLVLICLREIISSSRRPYRFPGVASGETPNLQEASTAYQHATVQAT
jgi:hypothetical protein